MNWENSPLEPWMVDHIRKMKEGLGAPPAAPDAEEDTMDEELGALNTVADVDAEDAVDAGAVDDAEAVDLAVYKDPNVQASVNRRNKLAESYKKYYDDLTAKIMAQRTGPSFSERMYQLSAAFASPTGTRGFGGVMGNIMPVLQEQAKAQREGMNKRQDALSALKAAQLGQRAGLANQDVTTALAMAKLNQPKPPVGVDVGGVLRDRATNQVIGGEFNRVPKAEYYAWIEKNATPTDLAAALEFYPTFTVELKAAFDRGAKNKGR
jgi:hypothetical protein